VDAISSWLRAQGRGILKMATGTGKTKVALMAASRIVKVHAEREQPVAIVIVAPYQHLVDQWVEEVSAFGVRPIAVYQDRNHWMPQVEEALSALNFGLIESAVFVVTQASLALEHFQAILTRIRCPMLFIGDEVHNLGSRDASRSLPSNATYRLGLSATPERFMDPEGTQALLDYFGPIVFELSMQEAIEMGALCHYDYFPRLVELDDDEMGMYVALSAQIAALLAVGQSPEDLPADSPLGLLLRKRSNILGHAAGKMALFASDVKQHAADWYQLVYCAEGNRPSDQGQDPDANQLAEAVKLLGVTMSLSTYSYISQTPRNERRALLRRFQTGDDLRFLVAMRCLDEGVDIPDARIAYVLASSSNPRQFIQRRGRLLRQPPIGEKKAVIYDYLAIPQASPHLEASEVERNLVRRELQRAVEFGRLSDNYAESLRVLRELRQRYQLMDV